MKKIYLLLICSVFSIVIIFPKNYAKCQSYSPVNYTAGESPSVPELYMDDPNPELYTDDQNTWDETVSFSGVTAVGNILYIPMTKTFMPSFFTTPSP